MLLALKDGVIEYPVSGWINCTISNWLSLDIRAKPPAIVATNERISLKVYFVLSGVKLTVTSELNIFDVVNETPHLEAISSKICLIVAG